MSGRFQQSYQFLGYRAGGKSVGLHHMVSDFPIKRVANGHQFTQLSLGVFDLLLGIGGMGAVFRARHLLLQ